MSIAVRAIICRQNQILVMHRNKHGSEYFTLVGGRVAEEESLDAALKREVKEETGLDVTTARLVYIEKHPAPYNEQYIYVCEATANQPVSIQEWSEEGAMNRIGINLHRPLWAEIASFKQLPFRTPQLQKAILSGLQKGFPETPVEI